VRADEVGEQLVIGEVADRDRRGSGRGDQAECRRPWEGRDDLLLRPAVHRDSVGRRVDVAAAGP
jgi:hypothetical protein